MFRIAPGPPQSGSSDEGRTDSRGGAAERGKDRSRVDLGAGRDVAHGCKWERHRLRYRQFEADQTLQALRAAAMRVRGEVGRWIDDNKV